MRGACTRGESCTFAHNEEDLQSKPDLSCTKPCPDWLSSGRCSRPGCKYAHENSEIRQLEMEEPEAPAMECAQMPLQATQSSTTQSQMPSFAGSCSAAHPVRQKPRTAPQVVSLMNDVALSGAVSMGEMIYHLTNIFVALYAARPDIANSLNVSADVLASATAQSAWAGADSTALLSFQDVVRWCALPADVLCQQAPYEYQQPLVENSKRSDSDTWSQCSTDDDSSNQSVTRCNSSGWETLESSEDLEEEEGWREPELGVVNTFIHFSPRRSSKRVRRSKSLPGRLN